MAKVAKPVLNDKETQAMNDLVTRFNQYQTKEKIPETLGDAIVPNNVEKNLGNLNPNYWQSNIWNNLTGTKGTFLNYDPTPQPPKEKAEETNYTIEPAEEKKTIDPLPKNAYGLYGLDTEGSLRWADPFSPAVANNHNKDNGEKGNGGNNGGLTPSIQWEQELASLYDRLANLAPPKIGDFKGPTFNYDYRDDPSYQQYRQQYVRNGQLAMQDTMGQAAGLTGGYGSSYSQNVGQQAYQGYMNQLNAVVPELYQNAYNRYLNDYSNQYNEWRDKYSADLDAYKAQLSGLGNQYDFINNEIARNTPQGYSVDDIVKLYKAGLGVDENGNYYELPTEVEQSGTEAQNATPSTTSNVPAEERKYTGKVGSILNSDIRMGKDAGGNIFTYTVSKNQATQDGRRKAEVIDREIDEAKKMPGYPTMGTKEQQAQFIVTALRQQGYSDLEISYVLETLDEE